MYKEEKGGADDSLASAAAPGGVHMECSYQNLRHFTAYSTFKAGDR